MPVITNVDAARRLAQTAVAAGLTRAAEALAARGYRPAMASRQEQDLAAQLIVRTDQLTTLEDRLAAARTEADRAGVVGDRQVALVQARHAEHLAEIQAQADEKLTGARERTERAQTLLGDVVQELIDRGHTELVKSGRPVAELVAEALDADPPEGSEITQRLAECVWAAAKNSPACQHEFLPERACREIAFVLAPIVAGWLADARNTAGATT